MNADDLYLTLNKFSHPKTKITLDSIFKSVPDGDFIWEDEVGSGEIPWMCDDEECGARWHICIYYTNIGMKNGKRFIEILFDSHADGDAQPCEYWEDGMNPDEILQTLSNIPIDYFKSWAEFYLDCANESYDFISQETIKSEKYILFAQENIEFLMNSRL